MLHIGLAGPQFVADVDREPSSGRSRMAGRLGRGLKMRGTIQFLTETGSRYEVNYDLKTWKRLSKTSKSGFIRGESGNLLHYPAIIVGQPCTIVDDAILPG